MSDEVRTVAASGRRQPSVAWMCIRLTALVLAVLVLTHFALTHLITDVAMTDSAFVAARWQSGIVAAADWLMLVAAVVHGGAGAWTIADDYLLPGGRRRAVRAAIWVLGTAMVLGGTVTLLAVLA
jgi:succinate dehydrogenase / fumarate reductase membrane anchor subunit